MDGADDTEFVLRFAGPVVEAQGAAPAAAVAAALNSMQRLAHLVGMQQDGRDLGQRARVPSNVQARYMVLCGVSEPGSLLEPVRLVSLEGDLLTDEATLQAGRTLKKFFCGVQDNDAGAVNQAAPDRAYRRLMLLALLAMAPTAGNAVTLEILDSSRSLALSTNSARSYLESLLKPEPNINQDGVLTGRLDEIDFVKRSLLLLETSSQRKLTCIYDEAVEPMLLDHPRELIQVHGVIVRDETGQPLGIQDVTLVQPLDLSPIRIEVFSSSGEEIWCDPPLDLLVEFDASTGVLTSVDPDLSIDAYGETRDLLDASLHSDLETLWRHYASADPTVLTEDAATLRQRLRERFKVRDVDAA